MPKAVEIEHFAAKLGLICKKLNWSRARLAQQVGIDKSLAGRWLAGAGRPTANSLMRLNEAVAASLPEFGAATWDLDGSAFALRLRIESGPAPVQSTNATNHPFNVAGLAHFNARLDQFASIFSGFYRGWYISPIRDDCILRRRIRIWREGDELRLEVDGNSQSYVGICFVLERQLCFVVEGEVGSPAVGIMQGPYTKHPRRLVGFIVFGVRARASGGVGTAPVVAEFVKPMSGDPLADAATWDAFAAETLDISDEAEKQRIVPSEVLAVLRQALPAPSGRKGVIDRVGIVHLLD